MGEELGGLRIVRTRPWGPVTERRFVLPSGLEVESGIAPLTWAATDEIDPGTRRVVGDGLIPLYDPDGLLDALSAACSADDAPHERLEVLGAHLPRPETGPSDEEDEGGDE